MTNIVILPSDHSLHMFEDVCGVVHCPVLSDVDPRMSGFGISILGN